MKNKVGKTIKLSPAWLIAYGVLCGLGAAGMIVLLVSRPRGEPVRLIAAPTRLVTSTAHETAVTPSATSTPAPTIAFPIDINAATADELDQLPGIGPALAQSIVAYREVHGPFETVEAIQKVPDIGPITYEAILPFITVSRP